MTYDQLLAQYRANGGQVGTDAQNQAFNAWTQNIMNTLGVSSWDQIPANAFQTVNPQTGAAATPASTPAVSSGFNADAYYKAYPDILTAFQGLAKDAQGNAILPDGEHLNQAQFAEYHYNNYGKAEGKTATYNQPAAATTSTGPIQTYLAAHPEITNNYLTNSGLQSQFGSLAKYALAYINSNGSAADKAAVAGADATLSDNDLFPALGYEQQGGAESTQPLEQQLLGAALPGLEGQIAGDAGRQQEVTDLTNQATADYGNLRNVLGGSNVTFDSVTYFKENPDVAAAFNALQNGPTPGTKLDASGNPITADQYAQQSYEQVGKAQGKQPAYTSQVLAGQDANADRTAASVTAANDTAAQAQLTALGQSIGAMQQNLQGALGQKAAALKQLIDSYTTNLSSLDATQRQDLAQQIATQQQDLQQSVTAQQQALQTEVDQLRGNNSEAAQTRTTALNAQLAQLQAAQAPLNDARTKGAEALVTSINLGLQSTQDQLRAAAATDGYVGGSTMQDAALARAAIGARQDAATQIASARVANATDDRSIQQNDATQRYSIADALATGNKSASDMGATGQGALAAQLATGTQALGDTQATGLRTIGDTTASNLENINNQGAAQSYTDTTTGADQARALADSLAQGGYSINSALAQQNQQTATTAAGQKSSYYDQLYPAAVNAAQIAAGLTGAEAQTKASLIPYGTAGTTNALNTLNWWSNPTAAPATTASLTSPSTVGNQIAGLGANLAGTAFQVGANQWWKTPTPATTTTPPSLSGVTDGSTPLL